MSDVPKRIKNKGKEAFGTLLNNSSVSEKSRLRLRLCRESAPAGGGGGTGLPVSRARGGRGGKWGKGACSGPPLPPSKGPLPSGFERRSCRPDSPRGLEGQGRRAPG